VLQQKQNISNLALFAQLDQAPLQMQPGRIVNRPEMEY